MKELTTKACAVILAIALCIAMPLAAFAAGEPVATDPYENAAKSSLISRDYNIDITFEGGSGKATVASPALMTVKGGKAIAKLEWSSPNYDYMIVGGQKYLPINKAGENSVFEVPIIAFDEPVQVIGDTTAMSTPHEITYTITFISDSATPAKSFSLTPFVIAAVVIAAIAAILYFVRIKLGRRVWMMGM